MGSKVGETFNVPLFDDINVLKQQSDIIIIAVSDAHLPQMALNLSGYSGFVLHTAGSCPLSVLTENGLKGGVLYPYQTLTKGRALAPAEIPFCIEATDQECFTMLQQMTSRIGARCVPVNSGQRLVLHLAAVFACNFSNHLWVLSKEVLDDANLPFDLLQPLMKETLNKALSVGPAVAQTGPALRQDFSTLQKHLDLLQGNPALAEIYRILSESIIQHKNP